MRSGRPSDSDFANGWNAFEFARLDPAIVALHEELLPVALVPSEPVHAADPHQPTDRRDHRSNGLRRERLDGSPEPVQGLLPPRGRDPDRTLKEHIRGAAPLLHQLDQALRLHESGRYPARDIRPLSLGHRDLAGWEWLARLLQLPPRTHQRHRHAGRHGADRDLDRERRQEP